MKGRASPLLLVASALLASAADTPGSRPTRARIVSAQTSARINTEVSRYTPPAPATPSVPAPLAATATDASPNSGDSTAADDIVRLPRYEVRERPLPRFRERELLTRAGRLDLVVKRHPGLKLGPLSRLNLRRGLEMLEEEQQIERSREMADLIGFQRFVAVTRNRPARPTRVAAE